MSKNKKYKGVKKMGAITSLFSSNDKKEKKSEDFKSYQIMIFDNDETIVDHEKNMSHIIVEKGKFHNGDIERLRCDLRNRDLHGNIYIVEVDKQYTLEIKDVRTGYQEDFVFSAQDRLLVRYFMSNLDRPDNFQRRQKLQDLLMKISPTIPEIISDGTFDAKTKQTIKIKVVEKIPY